MRKGLLVIVMIAASFAGGATINGPGLSLAHSRLKSYLDGVLPASDNREAPEVTDEIPSAPAPPLVLESSVSPRDTRASSDSGENTEGPSSLLTAGTRLAESASEEPPPSPAPLSMESNLAPEVKPVKAPTSVTAAHAQVSGSGWGDLADSAAPARAIPRRGEPRAATADPNPNPAPAAAAVPIPRRDPAVERASLPPLEAPPTSAPAGRSGGSDWAILRRRMQELGVRQYWIEGQPGGPTRFRCVIPVAGKSAVAQHFEAEAADEFKAAEAVLRRVTLWRATEDP